MVVVVVGRLRGAGNCQFLQVVHEDLQADVIGENRSPSLLLRQRANKKGKKEVIQSVKEFFKI